MGGEKRPASPISLFEESFGNESLLASMNMKIGKRKLFCSPRRSVQRSLGLLISAFRSLARLGVAWRSLAVALCVGGWLLASASGAFAQQFSIGWAKIGGSSTSSGGAYSVSGTLSPTVAGAVSGGNYTLENSQWGIIAGLQSSGVSFLAITAAGRLMSGDFQLTFNGNLDQTYMLQASTNLTDWETVLTFTCTSSPMVVVDPGSGNYPRRFYRIVQ